MKQSANHVFVVSRLNLSSVTLQQMTIAYTASANNQTLVFGLHDSQRLNFQAKLLRWHGSIGQAVLLGGPPL